MTRDVRPRAIRPAVGGDRRGLLATKGVPADLLRDASRRLGLAGLVYAIGFTASILLNQVFLRLGWARTETFLFRNLVQAIALLLGLAVFAFSRRSQLSPARVIIVGLGFEIVGGFLLVLPENLLLTTGPAHTVGISWLAVWVTFFPLLVPARPWVAAIASLVTAAMSPLAMSVLTLVGRTPPPVSTLTFAYLPNFIAALLAIVPAVVLHRLRGQVAEARALGSYRLVERLGEGGMGEVWRASHRMLARPAAIKLISADALASATGAEAEELVQRFEREAQSTASLSSPHTVELYDFGVTEDGTFYYVMELLDGIDLQRLVERHGPLPAERVIAMLLQVCESLEEAHGHGLVHRDIKPANILVCTIGGKHDFVKVLDFGLVAHDPQRQPHDARITQDNVSPGTPAFMSPEMASGGALDGRVDLYALGCVAYWLLTATLVFEGRSMFEMIAMHLHADPEPVSRRAKQTVPPELEAIVMACLAKSPGGRPASAAELGRRLEGVRLTSSWSEEHAAAWWRECAAKA